MCHPEFISGSRIIYRIRTLNKNYYVYILTNERNTVLYIGVTNDILKRVYQHKEKLIEGFTSKYNVYKLVYYEVFEEIDFAIKREKQLKNWHKDWKWNLIKEKNPELRDLYEDVRQGGFVH